MSAWDVDRAADNALLTWSSFDEMAWDELRENDDHIAPETGALTRNMWSLKDEFHRKTNSEVPITTGLISNPISQKLAKPDSDLEAMQESIANLNSKEANLCSQEETKNVPGDSSISTSETRSRTNGLASWLNGSDEEQREASKACKFESTSNEVEDSDYQDSGTDIAEGSCPFSLPEICLPVGGLECFEVPEEGKGGNFLQDGWEQNNLEDMDKLFLNDDPLVPQSFDESSDGMLWESSSDAIGSDIIYQSIKNPLSPESRALKGDVKGLDTTMEFVPCETPIISTTKMKVGVEAKGLDVPCNGNLGRAVTSEKQTEYYVYQSIKDRGKPPGLLEGLSISSKSMEDDGPNTPKEVEKAIKPKRHAARYKKIEDRSKKQVFEGKSALNTYNNSQNTNDSQLPCMPFRIQPPSSSSQDFSSPSMPCAKVLHNSVTEPRSCMQYPQPFPYVHAGFGFPIHHMPITISGTGAMPQQLQQVQPVFNSYQPFFLDASKPQKLRNNYEASSQPFVGSPTMTPQEKIEKLRWRQKMQARLAVKHQQQKLINQHLIPDPKHVQRQQQFQGPFKFSCLQDAPSGPITCATEPLVWSEGSTTKDDSSRGGRDDSLAAVVLQQLIDIVSELDTRTRLCLRDGFHRLAGSAMQRRAVANGRNSSVSSGEPPSESCGPESSSGSEQSSCNRRILTVAEIVETETNPMDRFIAQLLFHKRSPATLDPVYMSSNSCAGNSQELLHQSTWALQTASRPTEVVPGVGPSVVKCSSPVLSKALESAHIVMDAPETNDSCLRLAGPPGLAEVNIVDRSKEAQLHHQNFFSYESMGGIMRGHTIYNTFEGGTGVSSERMQHQEATEEKSSSIGGAMDKHFSGDQNASLTSASLHSEKLHGISPRDATPSDISLGCTIKDDAEMVELEDPPNMTVLHLGIDNYDMVQIPHVPARKGLLVLESKQ